MSLAVRNEYTARFGREELTLWSGAFASDYEGAALELPRHDGYMVTTWQGDKVRVACESPRTDTNYRRVDAAIRLALLLEVDRRWDSPSDSPQWHAYWAEVTEARAELSDESYAR